MVVDCRDMFNVEVDEQGSALGEIEWVLFKQVTTLDNTRRNTEAYKLQACCYVGSSFPVHSIGYSDTSERDADGTRQAVAPNS